MIESTQTYSRIARMMELLEEAEDRSVPLAELASEAGMSPAHLQREFSRWVGVSPKRYEQYLRLDHAKDLLRNRHTVLDTTYATGLSGPGRLHDLFVRWEAMTPGEFARAGADLRIAFGWFASPFGEVLAMGTGRGLCGMAFAAETGRDAAFDDMSRRWPAATFEEEPDAIAHWVAAAFGSGGEASLHMIGAPFQIKVWEALLTIPSGHVTTYSDIAAVVGNPKAVRAVGTAVGRNPISWLIPCHRAMRKSGGLGGYHWGLPVKRAMLAWESARLDARETDAA